MQHRRTNRTTTPSASLPRDYSQNGEQRIIEQYFSKMKLGGNVLDIGANDGVTFSNSHWLIKEKGWGATLVEPSPKAFDRLTALYSASPKVQCVNRAVGDHNGPMILKESGALIGTSDVALVSSFLPEEQARWASLNMPFEEVEVLMVDVPTLLQKCAYDQYHFISIDIEGMEPVVVPQFDFNRLGAVMVCIEWNGKEKPFFDTRMGLQGYHLIHQNAENLIYAK